MTANDHLLTFDVPVTATNVDYRTAFFSGLIDAADFDIAESDFLEWMRETNRQPIAFSTTASSIKWADGKERFGIDLSHVIPVSAILGFSDDEREIEAGFYFDDCDEGIEDDSGLTIIYDSVRHRAYIQQTTF